MRGAVRSLAPRWRSRSHRWAAALILASPSTLAAAFDAHDRSWEGISEFATLAAERLGAERVRATEVLDWRELRPADGVLVLHPLRDIDFVEASTFLRAGGRLAVLDDHGRSASLLERFRIRRVPPPAEPRDRLRSDPDLAIAVPAVQVVAGQEQGRHPIVAAVTQLVTNHPTGLDHPDLTPVLTIPARGEPDVTLAVTGIIADRGRLFAMGDPSALINLMLRYPGNRALATGLIDYLVEDDTWGTRGGRLFILANDFEERRSTTGAAGLVRELDEHLTRLRTRLSKAHEEGVPDPAAWLLAALAALGAIAWILSRSTRPYRPAVPRFARPTPPIAQGGAAGRVALLAAPSTHRVLALLELSSALQERLGYALGLVPPLSWSLILAEIDRQQALSQPSSDRLRHLVQQIRGLEAAVSASRPVRATARMVLRMRATIEGILEDIDRHKGSGP